MNILKGIYTFLAGDWIILIGILLTVALLVCINFVEALSALKGFSGIIIIVAVLAILTATLSREAYSRRS